MRIFQLTSLAAACAFVMLANAPASAQQASPNAPPPKLQKLDDSEQPAVTIRQPATTNEITEKRAPGGDVKEVKVKSGNSTYTLKPKSQTTSDSGDNISVPQWTVHEFGGNQPKTEEDIPDPQLLQPAPAKK